MYLTEPEQNRRRSFRIQIIKLYETVKYKVEGACDFCANAFGVKEEIKKINIPLLDEYEKHPSLRQYVAEGYSVITF